MLDDTLQHLARRPLPAPFGQAAARLAAAHTDLALRKRRSEQTAERIEGDQGDLGAPRGRHAPAAAQVPASLARSIARGARGQCGGAFQNGALWNFVWPSD
eukprot:1374007-Pleurochrysis_carterae.AAC.1